MLKNTRILRTGSWISNLYWISNLLFCLMMTISGILYLAAPGFEQRFDHLGFPSYFRIELALCKFAGVVILLAPVSSRLKEWAYAGFFIDMFSACIAHLASGDGVKKAIAPLTVAAILVVTYLTDHGL